MSTRREMFETNDPEFTVELDTGGWTDKYRLLHNGAKTEWADYGDVLMLGGKCAVSPFFTDKYTWWIMSVEEAAAIVFVGAEGPEDPVIMI